ILANGREPTLGGFTRTTANSSGKNSTYIASNGYIADAPGATMRFGHSQHFCRDASLDPITTPTCPRRYLGVMVEEPSENLIAFSERFNGTISGLPYWTVPSPYSVAATNAQSPRGSNQA